MRDIATAAGVSMGTVSNVLNHPERVSPQLVERVQAHIERLGYVRNDAARQLRAGRSDTIGLVVLDLRNPFFTEVARGAEIRGEERGLGLMVTNSDDRLYRERRHIDHFEEQRVRGLLITPTQGGLDRLHRVRDNGTPVVLVDRESRDKSFPSVSVDDVAGGYLATKHLLDTGRRRIAFTGGPLSIRQVTDRLEGAQRAAAEVPGASVEFLGTPALTVDAGRDVGRLICDRSPGDLPDGVFAANDLLAVGLLQAFVMIGKLRVPDDIALVGYDDIDFAASTVIPLTSVRQPAAEIGATAVDLLVDLTTGDGAEREHDRVVFQPELIVRGTA
nr:LacI family DNA-binding transcriptional regulator [Gulosibacter faecalis]